MTDIPQLARDLDYVKTNIGTTAQDHPDYYEAADRVLEYAGDQIANRIANGSPKPEPRTFAPGTIGAEQPTEEQRKAWQAGKTLGEVEAMGSAPAVTDEQRAAVEWLQTVSARGKLIVSDSSLDAYADAILAALPDKWTAPQPVLPTEPGHYVDEQGRHWLHQVYGPKSEPGHVDQWLDWNGQNGAPPTGKLTRLVPERPQITREQIEVALSDGWRADGVIDPAADLILALVNGADQ